MTSSQLNSDFSDYVEHPYYGRGPRYTALQVDLQSPDVNLHSNTAWCFPLPEEVVARWSTTWMALLPLLPTEPSFIEGTAVAADLARQTSSERPVTHYFDVRSQCRDCQRLFLFFADEQKKYYEQFKLPLEVQAVRCFPCRKKYQHRKRLQKRYGTLRTKFPDCTPKELLELVQVMLELIELKAFRPEKLRDVQRFLKLIPADFDRHAAVTDACDKVKALEASLTYTSRGQK